jgi:hypothetical protein
MGWKEEREREPFLKMQGKADKNSLVVKNPIWALENTIRIY